MVDDRVVSVGFLTKRDLDVLGRGFTRHFAINNDDMFTDLLAKLDEIEVESLGGGAIIKKH